MSGRVKRGSPSSQNVFSNVGLPCQSGTARSGIPDPKWSKVGGSGILQTSFLTQSGTQGKNEPFLPSLDIISPVDIYGQVCYTHSICQLGRKGGVVHYEKRTRQYQVARCGVSGNQGKVAQGGLPDSEGKMYPEGNTPIRCHHGIPGTLDKIGRQYHLSFSFYLPIMN